jgi:excinuclease UvrABC nuclease subunit
VIEVTGDLASLDAAIEALPNTPAVFALWPKEGAPYLSKTALLLKEREKPSRLLNLRHTVARIEYWLTGSAFESSVVLYEQARRYFPESYLDLLRLRMPPYLKIVLNNEFPRSHITTHLTRTGGLYFGPFRARASAEKFEGQFLDLFQVRRCQEDLVPSPAHPGCIYGEMGMCLRPCQLVVGAAEYAHEVARLVEFLRTDGRSRTPSRIPATASATRCSSRRPRASTSVWKKWRTC